VLIATSVLMPCHFVFQDLKGMGLLLMMNLELLLCSVASAQPAPALVDIFTSGASTNSWSKGAAVTYRIPCLVVSSDVLLALASERVGGSSDESSTNLVQRRSTDGGVSWSNITLVVSAEVNPPFAAKHALISSAPWAVADAVGDRRLLSLPGSS
jgi:hypothetical protein